uniref:Glutathione S-transferase n=1 Tax=Rhizophora mucronata TaxID=61149 RepID=A0A2P2IY99_RHIMU
MHYNSAKDQKESYRDLLRANTFLILTRAMADEVMLLDFWPSVFGMRLRIALREKGVEFGYQDEDFSNKSALLLEMNPVHKMIPVLIHKGKPVCESLIALQYIDETWKDDKCTLMPSDPYQSAQARFWADFLDRKVHTLGKKTWQTKGETRDAARKEFLECLRLLEAQLGDEPYFGGETFGFLDVAFIPFHAWFTVFDRLGEVSIETECPKLKEWAERCVQRESVSKSIPDREKVYEFVYYVLRKRLGIE